MPNRVIRGEINRSRSLARMSIGAQLTFRALLSAVDDFGRLEAHPDLLKADLFPIQRSITPEQVLEWVRELSARHDDAPVVIYQVDGKSYLCLVNWEKHRGPAKRAAKSKYPAPPENRMGDPRIPGNSREFPSEGVVVGEGVVGGEGGAGGPHLPASPAAPGKPVRRKPADPAYQADGWDLLPDDALEALARLRPRGHLYSREQVSAWFAQKAESMRNRGKKNLYRTALNWFPRVTSEEIKGAEAWCAGENARRSARDAPANVREITPELRAAALVNARRNWT